MVAAFAMMVVQILALSDINLQSACYMGVYAFVLAEFAAALEWQLHYFLWGEQDPVWWQQYILLAAVFAVVYGLYWLVASRLMLSAQKSFLLLKVENYCPTPPDFRDGLPATTKRDRENHGFGLKSIRLTAQKYGGYMTTAVEDDRFVLKVLIPMKK